MLLLNVSFQIQKARRRKQINNIIFMVVYFYYRFNIWLIFIIDNLFYSFIIQTDITI